MTAALTQLHESGEIPATLRFHRYPRSVLLGLNQPCSAIDFEFCQMNGIASARRVTGGGAVFMSPDILAWEIVTPLTWFVSLERAASVNSEAIAAALRQLGLNAVFSPPNAVTFEGRKISGAAGSFAGRTLVLQGTVIISCDFNEVSRALRCDAMGLAQMSDVVSVSLIELTEALSVALPASLDCATVPGRLGAAEEACADRLMREDIGRDDFVWGNFVPLRRSA
jgi:lipoate-protein ligase A